MNGYRCGRVWVLLATAGTGLVWQVESLKHMSRTPLVLFGHSIKLCPLAGSKFRVLVQVEASSWRRTRGKLLKAALTPPPGVLAQRIQSELDALGVLPYSGTLQQQRSLLSAVDARRRAAGLKRLSTRPRPRNAL